MRRTTHYDRFTDRRKARQCLFLKAEFSFAIKEFRAFRVERALLSEHESAQQTSLFLAALKRDLDRAQKFGCKWAIRASVPLGCKGPKSLEKHFFSIKS